MPTPALNNRNQFPAEDHKIPSGFKGSQDRATDKVNVNKLSELTNHSPNFPPLCTQSSEMIAAKLYSRLDDIELRLSTVEMQYSRSPCFVDLDQKKSGQSPMEQLNLFVYETDTDREVEAKSSLCRRAITEIHPKLRLLDTAQTFAFTNLHVVGQGTEFRGFGAKWLLVLESLKNSDLSPEDIVVVADNRDVMINMHKEQQLPEAIKAFKGYIAEVCDDHNGAVLISAEKGCCVAALTHNNPGDFFNDDGSRGQRTCDTSQQSCAWRYVSEIHEATDGIHQSKFTDEKVLTKPWEVFQKFIARYRNINQTGNGSDQKGMSDSVFLNMGLLAGRKKDVESFISSLDLKPFEDDQAVATDFFYRYPEKIVLDYNSIALGSFGFEADCPMSFFDESSGQLRHIDTHQSPLFVHYPGFTTTPTLIEKCFYTDAQKLGHDLSQLQLSEQCLEPIFEVGETGRNSFGNLRGAKLGTDSPKNSDYLYGNYGNYGNYESHRNDVNPNQSTEQRSSILYSSGILTRGVVALGAFLFASHYIKHRDKNTR